MKISVILPTKNSARTMKKCLTSLTQQTNSDFEVIVVDNYSSDDTVEIATSFKKSLDIHIYQKGPERNIQRPYGYEKSSGEVVYFIDSDMYVSPTFIAECKEILQKSTDVGAIIIPEKNITDGYGYWARVKAFERDLYNGDDSIEAARVFRKEIYEVAGGYNEKLISGEDWDLSDRVRDMTRIVRTSCYVYHDEGAIQLHELLRKKFYYGKKFVNYAQHNNTKKIGSKIYFFRKSFYSHWRDYVAHPLLFLGFFVMINLSFIAGGLGFISGKIQK